MTEHGINGVECARITQVLLCVTCTWVACQVTCLLAILITRLCEECLPENERLSTWNTWTKGGIRFFLKGVNNIECRLHFISNDLI